MKHHISPICGVCGSTNVRKDAYAEWDTTTQSWVLSTVFDENVCDDCGYDGKDFQDTPILTRIDQLVYDYGEDGYTHITTWLLPPDNPDPEQLHEQLHEQIPETHCLHQHDCCGNIYASKAQVFATTNPLMFITSQAFRRNI